jgi:hypothetical protein
MIWTVKQIPEFYQKAAAQEADPETRAAAAAEFRTRLEDLKTEAAESSQWQQEFKQSEINSWLTAESEENPDFLPQGVNHPLLVISDDRFQLGVELNWEDWMGIVSVEAGVEVYGPRTLRFRLYRVRLGNLEVAMDEVRRRVKPQIEANQSEDYRAAWMDTPDGPVIEVALTNPESDHLGISEITLQDGQIVIQGVNRSQAEANGLNDQRP